MIKKKLLNIQCGEHAGKLHTLLGVFNWSYIHNFSNAAQYFHIGIIIVASMFDKLALLFCSGFLALKYVPTCLKKHLQNIVMLPIYIMNLRIGLHL